MLLLTIGHRDSLILTALCGLSAIPVPVRKEKDSMDRPSLVEVSPRYTSPAQDVPNAVTDRGRGGEIPVRLPDGTCFECWRRKRARGYA